jgi:dTDP-4-dehydrorhamnose reductase
MGKLFLTGGSGFIGGNLVTIAARSDWEVTAAWNTNRPDIEGVEWVQLDFTDEKAVMQAISDTKPDAVIHLGAISGIDLCETDQASADSVNVKGTANVRQAAFENDARLVVISTDNVFDGERGNYGEEDEASPVNYYGQTKLNAERETLEHYSAALVVRIPLVLGFTRTGSGSSINGLIRTIRENGLLWFLTDEIRTPIDAITLSEALLELADSDMQGVIHVAGTERVSRADIGMLLLKKLGLPEDRASYLSGMVPGADERAMRPKDISLDVTRASLIIQTQLLGFQESMDRIWEYARPEDTAI